MSAAFKYTSGKQADKTPPCFMAYFAIFGKLTQKTMEKVTNKDEWKFIQIKKGIPVWGCTHGVGDELGPYYVTFDKQTIYNLWSDSDELSEGQKELIKEATPKMWELTCVRP